MNKPEPGKSESTPLPPESKPHGSQSGEPGRGIHRKLTLNSISNVSRYAVTLVLAFILTPFIVRTLGDSQYGFWVVLISFVGYAGILEMGVQPAVVRLVGRTRGEGDYRKLEELVTAAFLFFAGVGAVSAIVFVAALPPLLPRFIQGFQMETPEILFALIALDVAVMFQNYLYAGVLYGWQMYHAKNLIDACSWILNAIVIFLFLEQGGLVLLAAAKLASDLVALAATILICRRTVPEARLNFRAVRRGSFGELLSFGGKVFVSATATRLSTYAQPIVISSMVSTTATAFFAIPTRLVEYARQIVWSLATGFMPMFSELDGRQDQTLIRKIYLDYSRYIVIVTLPVVLLIFVYGRDFISMWINPEYAERGGDALILLTGAALVEGLQPLLWRLFLGVGRLNVPVAVSSTASLVAIVLAILLIRPLGIAGVALSVLATTVASQVILGVYVARYFSISPGTMFKQILLRPLGVGVAFYILMLILARYVGSGSYLQIVLGGGIGLMVYASMTLAISITASERTRLFQLIGTRLPGRGGQEI